MKLSDVLTILQTLMPLLVPLAAYLLGLAVKHSPFLRNPELQRLAGVAVQAIEQQGKQWSSEQKYVAAADALSLLASKAGYKVDPNEAKSLIESSVLVLRASVLAGATPSGVPVPAGQSVASPDNSGPVSPVPPEGTQDGVVQVAVSQSA